MSRVIWLALLLALIASCVSADQAPVTLDLQSVAKMAGERSLSVLSAKSDALSARQAVREVRGYQQGSIQLKAEYLYLDDIISTVTPAITIPGITLPAPIGTISLPAISIPPVELAPRDLIHVKLQAGYPLYTGGKISYGIGQAKHGVAARDALVDDSVAASVEQCVDLYIGAILARDVVQVNREALKAYEEHLDQARKAMSAGVVAEYDVVRAESAVKDQEKRVTDAQNQFDLAILALRTGLRMPDEQPVELQGALFEIEQNPDRESVLRQASDTNSALRALEQKRLAAEAGRRVEQASGKPQVLLIAQTELARGNLSQTDPKWFVGVDASFDLFDGGVRNARIAQRESDVTRAELEREEVADQIKLGIRSALLDMESARSGLAAARMSEKFAAESLRLASKRFDVGVGTSLEALDATVSLSAARVGIKQSLYQMDKAYVRLHRLLGDVSTVCAEGQK